MNTAPECDKVLLVQAEFDGELDAAEAAALAVHRDECPVCRAAAAELTQARSLIGPELYNTTPEALRARIAAQVSASQPVERPGPKVSWSASWFDLSAWRSVASFGLGAACAAALTLLVIAPRDSGGLTDQILASHIRALQPGHLEDVVSTDRHTVKPWFDGRIDFAPPVKDLAAEHFPLIGGRLDYLAERPVAAMVYQRDKHIINLFAWPSPTPPAAPETAQRQGYNIVHWVQDGMALWAVSDVEMAQLQQFAEDWRRAP